MLGGVGKAEVYWDLAQIKELREGKEVLRQFEVYLVNQFLKEAEKSIPRGLFSSKESFSLRLYRDLFSMELSQKIGNEIGKSLDHLFERCLKAYGKEEG